MELLRNAVAWDDARVQRAIAPMVLLLSLFLVSSPTRAPEIGAGIDTPGTAFQLTFNGNIVYTGGISALELRGGKQAAFDFLRRLRITKNAVSLGSMESLARHAGRLCANSTCRI